jgi:hypothetical protein
MRRAILVAALAVGLCACGVVSQLTDGMKYAKAVEEDLEQAIGLKPAVDFDFNNGRLTAVTVAFPRLYDAKPLRELASTTRAAVEKEFKQTPDNVILSFALGKGEPRAN